MALSAARAERLERSSVLRRAGRQGGIRPPSRPTHPVSGAGGHDDTPCPSVADDAAARRGDGRCPPSCWRRFHRVAGRPPPGGWLNTSSPTGGRGRRPRPGGDPLSSSAPADGNTTRFGDGTGCGCRPGRPARPTRSPFSSGSTRRDRRRRGSSQHRLGSSTSTPGLLGDGSEPVPVWPGLRVAAHPDRDRAVARRCTSSCRAKPQGFITPLALVRASSPVTSRLLAAPPELPRG